MKRVYVLLLGLLVVLSWAGFAAGQKIETVNGVKLVHNEKGGQWGKSPKVALELVRKIGDIDAEDETVAFNQPGDVAVDAKGNIYILDSANARVQKFGPDGKFLASFGRKGQGPAEFVLPDSVNISAEGRLVVFDPHQRRIQISSQDGQDIKMIPIIDQQVSKLRLFGDGGYAAIKGGMMIVQMPGTKAASGPTKLLKIFDREGKLVKEFGDLIDLGDPMTSNFASTIAFDVNDRDEIVAAYQFQNRVEKFAPDGKILWRADRPLNYAVEVKAKGEMKTSGLAGGRGMSTSYKAPQMNSCTAGVAVDQKGRAWVVTYNRQLRKEEQVQIQFGISMGAGGQTVSSKVQGDTDLRTTDALKLEIFDSEGVLLGEIRLTHFADFIRFQGDSLFLIDSQRGATVYQYRVVEK